MKGVLIYGVRRTVMYSGTKASNNYEAMLELFAQSQRPVDKMRATLALLTPPEDS